MLKFQRLKVGYPNLASPPNETGNSWKVYLVCKSDAYTSCNGVTDLLGLSQEDKDDARLSYISLNGKAATGEPLQNLYDGRKLHEAFQFTHKNTDIKVFRIWGSGKIRIYFIYCVDKKIVVLKTMTKRTQKITNGEKEEIKCLAIKVIEQTSLTGI
jgi:phage-related protein